MPAWLIALLAAAFVVHTDDYVIAGILPELARDLHVTTAQAGQLITVFSLTVAVTAPVAAVALARVSRRRLLTVALLVFAGANLAAAATPSFAVLMTLRVVAAAAAASLTPAVFAFVAQHAPPHKVGRYIAVVSLGVTGSIAAGVPLGTWIGGHLGWRATFTAVAIAGLPVIIALLATIPHQPAVAEVPHLAQQLRTLRRRPISLGLLANCVLMAGSMMMLTYLAAFLADTATANVNERALAFSLAGLAGIIGVWAGGIATDRWGPDRALAFGIGVIIATMACLWVLWLSRPAPIGLVLAVTTVWGGMAFWNSPALLARIHDLAGPVAPQALALNTSGTYCGVAVGGAIGGVTLSTMGPGALPVVAASLGSGAMILLANARRGTEQPPSHAGTGSAPLGGGL